MRTGSLLGSAAAALLLGGCGDARSPGPEARGACGAEAGAEVTGPFCLTRAGAIAELERAGLDLRCDEQESARVGNPFPLSIDRCRTGDGARFRLITYGGAPESLRARPTAYRELGVEKLGGRTQRRHNLLVVLERDDDAGRAVLREVERLGDEVT